MSVNGVASGKPATADLIAKTARDLFAGLVTSVMAVAYGLSFAALISRRHSRRGSPMALPPPS
jgi:hypothetical protein